MANSIEIDNIVKADWESIIDKFDDATLYQTWSYGSIRWGEKNLSHVVLKNNGDIIAGCQIRLLTLPLNSLRIAYITRGPMWRRKGTSHDPKIFQEIIRAIYNEYVVRRKMYLRVIPQAYNCMGNDAYLDTMLHSENYRKRKSLSPDCTLLLDTSQSLDVIRKNFHKTWRNNLNRAEKKNLEVLQGTGMDLYDVFSVLHKEMYARKKYQTNVQIAEFQAIQKDLPERHKMHILICRQDKVPVAALVSSIMGNTGITILGATSNDGLKSYGAYLLRWELVKKMNNDSIPRLDQGGIDKIKNKGGYMFKTGMGGIEVSQLGIYDACNSLVKRVIVQLGERLTSSK